jgi:cytochrome c-type biogenesis protein CcmH/NrfF
MNRFEPLRAVSLLLWVIGIGATLVGAGITLRSDRQSPRLT